MVSMARAIRPDRAAALAIAPRLVQVRVRRVRCHPPLCLAADSVPRRLAMAAAVHRILRADSHAS